MELGPNFASRLSASVLVNPQDDGPAGATSGELPLGVSDAPDAAITGAGIGMVDNVPRLYGVAMAARMLGKAAMGVFQSPMA
jgi:hypothetical protein